MGIANHIMGQLKSYKFHIMGIASITNPIIWRFLWFQWGHIMEFVWFQIQTSFKFFVQKSHFQVQMAGKVEATVRILVYWALAKKNERKTMKNRIFFVFVTFLFPKTKVKYNLSYFQLGIIKLRSDLPQLVKYHNLSNYTRRFKKVSEKSRK